MRWWICVTLSWLICCDQPTKTGLNADQDNRAAAYLNLSQEERLKPENATASFEVAEGLEIQLFASEPMVVNPTNIDVDEKGRVWVCESYNYAVPEEKQTETGGRISILEDTDGDGKADKRTIYYQGEDVNIALGISVLGNKVYVTRSPDLLVFTDLDGDDIPDRKEKLFTGMGKPGDHSAHALVFGPDGKFYFNMGNYAGPVHDAHQKIIVDKAGHEVVPYGENYLGGMVFRCNPDGSEFEVLGHNFRNNYEVAVDSYGTLWQSDNDDDGNKSCRINFVMEYGNYGYLDEMTRESWYSPRINAEKDIPQRHWHQSDPGVVPNLLITGAGSPAGMAVYEGELLPEIFHGQMIHTDAGPNVVRAYPVTKKGAGYEATVVNIAITKYDQWFRPVDVCVAPDGSLIVADWYDPIVGGGAAGDSNKGRIFRIAPDAQQYALRTSAVTSPDEAIDALKNPNLSYRYLGWMKLHGLGEKAEKVLMELYADSNPIYKARALWLLGKIPGKAAKYIEMAMQEADENIRITAVRLARQTGVDFIETTKPLVNDPSPAVRREVAIGLHLIPNRQAAAVWSDLALQYDGQDRWYLEALGIGAANNWDLCMEEWLQKAGKNLKSRAGQNIIWRSRAKSAIPLLAELILDDATAANDRLRYFRAFNFHTDPLKQQVLLGLLDQGHEHQNQITTLTLESIDPRAVGMPPVLRRSLTQTLANVKGTQRFVNLVKRYNLTSRKKDLLEMAVSQSGEQPGTNAAGLLLHEEAFKGRELIVSEIKKNNKSANALIKSIERLGSKASLEILSDLVMNSDYPLDIRKVAVLGLGKSWGGEEALLQCVKNPSFDQRLHTAAGSVLFNVYRVDIQEEAARHINRPGSREGKEIPPIRNLVASTGHVGKGKEVFSTYCQSCHMVNAEGIKFGPELSEIGNKLSKEGLYRAVLFPDEGINYGYEGYLFTMKDSSRTAGIIEDETSDVFTLRLMGGLRQSYKKEDVLSKEPMSKSLMPNLSVAMREEELVDLVEFLSQLK